MSVPFKFARCAISNTPAAQGDGSPAAAFRQYAEVASWLSPAACEAARMPREPFLMPGMRGRQSARFSARHFFCAAVERMFKGGRLVLRGVPVSFRLYRPEEGWSQWLAKPQYLGNLSSPEFYATLY